MCPRLGRTKKKDLREKEGGGIESQGNATQYVAALAPPLPVTSNKYKELPQIRSAVLAK